MAFSREIAPASTPLINGADCKPTGLTRMVAGAIATFGSDP
jgi:hypothetical protein